MGERDHEDLEVVARKELLEEIGGITSNLEYISYFYANNGVSDIRCDVFLARDVEIGDNHPEASELIEVEVFSKNDVFRMAFAGEITDGMSALSLFLCQKHL
jgi:ADP-ribose pyrophosphatase